MGTREKYEGTLPVNSSRETYMFTDDMGWVYREVSLEKAKEYRTMLKEESPETTFSLISRVTENTRVIGLYE